MQRQHERSGENFQRMLQREGKGKAIKYKDRGLWCIQYYCKQVAASNKLHCIECLINKIIFFINHCHWGRQVGKKKQETKQAHFLLACIYTYVKIWKRILFVFKIIGSEGICGCCWHCMFRLCFLYKSHKICPHKCLAGLKDALFSLLCCA